MPKRPPKVVQHIRAKIPIGVGRIAFIYRSSRSGNIWQYRHWINSEKKYFRISLHTTDQNDARTAAEKKFLELIGKIHSGSKVFSITAGEQVKRFLTYQESRRKDLTLSASQLTKYRYMTDHYLSFVGPNTTLDSISPKRFREYVHFRRRETPAPGFQTIKEEQSIIAALYRWSVEEQFVPPTMIPKFGDFKVPHTEGKREGIDEKIYNTIVTISKNWHKHTTDERDIYERKILHHAVLAQSWFGFRTGEMLGLEWRDIKFLADDTVEVTLRPEVTKTGKGRLNKGRADIFRRVQSFSVKTQPTDRIFSSFTKDSVYKTDLIYFYRRWRELKQLLKERHADFDMNTDPYVFRHFWITIKLLAGDSPYDIARMAGNSLRMIEKHYDQVKDRQIADKLLSKKVRFNPDGTVTVEIVKNNEAGRD